MKIKGKVFVHRVLALAPVGVNGFVDVDVFRIFKKKLYVNIKLTYILKKTELRFIPFKRVSEENDGFCFDFSDLSITYPEQIEEPSVDDGWIGPFTIDYEMFSYNKLYEIYLLSELRQEWVNAYTNNYVDMMNIYSSLIKTRIEQFIDEPFEYIEDEKSQLISYDKNMRDSMSSMELNDEDELWFKEVLLKNAEDLDYFDAILIKKKSLSISSFSLLELIYLEKTLDLTKQDADFERAGLIKKRIEFLEKEPKKIEIQSN